MPLGGSDHGACQVVVDQLDDEVHVRVLVGYDPEARDRRGYVDI